MSCFELFTLGSPRLEKDGAPVDFDTRKNLALVVYLAITGTRHSRERLITLLWPELEPSRARAGLRRNLSTLRKALAGEWLLVDRETVELDPETDFCVDVDTFRTLASPWQRHGHRADESCPQCLTDLAEAAELYQDDFLAGFSLRDSAVFDEWQFFETERLRRELVTVLEQLVRGHAAQGAYDVAIPYARRWLALDPLHELAHRHLMELYARAGQQSAAVRQYHECVERLQDELETPPAEETTALYDRIRTGILDQESATDVPHNLPAHSSPFVGREEELHAIVARLRGPDCRLLTLVGPGGIGKTRLALEAAAQVRVLRPAPFDRGVYFVRLGPLQSTSAIVPAIAEAIDFRFREGEPPRQQLLDYLQNKRTLLLLDSFEHLLGGLDVVTEILQKAPELRIMVTSRTNLNLQGEQLIAVEGMRTPDPAAREAAAESESVKLFIQRARQTRLGPEWAPAPEELLEVIRICRLVEGIPLGILLAAAWMEMLTPAEIAAEIERGLDFLSTDQRDLPTRQRSIRAVFDYSWSLLTAQERDRYQQLSVFRGGFNREAARAVASASLFELRALLGKSLLESGPAGRYEIHGLLRGYGLEALDRSPEDGDATRDRHSAYFSERLARWAADLKGERQQRAMDEIEADLDNVRAAWGWAAEHGPQARIETAMDGLGIYYQYSGLLDEGVAAFQALEGILRRTVSADGRRLLAKTLTVQATFKWFAEEWTPTRELLEQSYAILDSPELADHDVRREKAMTLSGMGYAADKMPEKERLFQESLALSRKLGDHWEVTKALSGMAWGVRNAGDYERANRLIEEALVILRTLGDSRGTANALGLLGNIAWRQGRYDRSERLLRETISTCEKLGLRLNVAYYRALLGTVYNARGRFQQGISLQKESVRVLGDFGAEALEHWWRIWLADCLVEQGDYQAARLEAETSHRFYAGRAGLHGTAHALLVGARAALATETHHEARQLLEEACAILRGTGNRESLALALTNMAYAAIVAGDLDVAENTLAKGLSLASQIGALNALVSGVPALALLRARQGQAERAIELYAVALTDPRVRNSKWFDDVVGAEIATTSSTLPPEVAAAARKRGQGRELKATVLEFLAETSG